MHVHSTIKRDELYTPYLLIEGKNLVYTVCIHIKRRYFSITNVYVCITHGISKQVFHGTQHAIAITSMQ